MHWDVIYSPWKRLITLERGIVTGTKACYLRRMALEILLRTKWIRPNFFQLSGNTTSPSFSLSSFAFLTPYCTNFWNNNDDIFFKIQQIPPPAPQKKRRWTLFVCSDSFDMNQNRKSKSKFAKFHYKFWFALLFFPKSFALSKTVGAYFGRVETDRRDNLGLLKTPLSHDIVDHTWPLLTHLQYHISSAPPLTPYLFAPQNDFNRVGKIGFNYEIMHNSQDTEFKS